MAGWMAGRLSGWMPVAPSDGTTILPAHREGMQGNQGRSGGMQGIVGGTKLATVPQGEVLCWATGQDKSASLDGEMDEYVTSLLSDGQKGGHQWLESIPCTQRVSSFSVLCEN